MGSDFQQPKQYLPGRYLHLIASPHLQILVLHNKCTTKLEYTKPFKTYSIEIDMYLLYAIWLKKLDFSKILFQNILIYTQTRTNSCF